MLPGYESSEMPGAGTGSISAFEKPVWMRQKCDAIQAGFFRLIR
jgi:hypothetical protein